MSTSNNAPGGRPTRSSRFAGRTGLITVGSVIAVGFAGALAIGANLGILESTTDGQVGVVSAAELVPDVQTIDVYLGSSTTAPGTTASTTVTTTASTPASTPAPAPPTAGVQEFTVDAAGTVTVGQSAQGIRLDSVAPAAGWTWSLAQPDATTFTVTLTNGARTLEFLAETAPDGTVRAGVSEPVPAATAATNGGSGHDDDDEGDDDYEGGEDDD